MFIDTSVIVAILSRDADAAAYADRIEAAKVRLIPFPEDHLGDPGNEDAQTPRGLHTKPD